jgi:hypothetical protein
MLSCRSLQVYIDTENKVTQENLLQANGFLELIANVKGAESKDIALELRRCAGACLKWCRKYDT